ncbi:GntR family transcriptional regulator [Streptomyces sp. NBC_00859]|uniref:GntR family transcriptional regulator n=1 Tax=Streptomyces sp. NBC_00859 TaxID=2903682 RepID=UPI00386D694B|nr:GntR family transcriptional regulator [Streptomyces sp. NBC_00859]
MEQGRARDAAWPCAPAHPAHRTRVPDPARSPEQRAAVGSGHGEHSRSEPAGPAVRPVPGGPEPLAAPGAKAVRRHSVRGQILDALRTALVDGDLVPGEVYSGPALGERFGVSATPVREAMQQLAVEGAVEVVPNRGFRVAERSAGELADLAEVRALIEVPVMLRLARTVPAGCWAELRPLADATVSAAAVGDRGRYAESDRAFHGAVLGLSGNQQLVAVADELHRKAQWPLVSAPVTRRADLVADASEHTALLDALIARDLAVVQSLVREHFTGAPG